MSLFDDYWTFRVQGCSALVAAHPDSEGLFILNETAGWIWQNANDPEVSVHYAHRYGLERESAEEDVSQALAYWLQQATLYPVKAQNPKPVIPPEPLLTKQYKIENVVIEVRYHSQELVREIQPRLEGLQTSNQSPLHVIELVNSTEGNSVIIDGVCLGTEGLVTATRIIFLQELARLAVRGREFEAILHAGAVGDSRNCLILAGQSFSGKSTLTAALMQAGMLCYSDDSAALTPDYLVAGLPFAISLREGSWRLFPHLNQSRFIPSNLGNSSPLAKPLGVIFVSYDPDATSTTLTPVDGFQTLVELQRSGFWVRHTQPSIRNFLDWVTALPSHRLNYSDLQSAMSEVRRLLSA